MRIAVVSDVHSNSDALDAVLRHAELAAPLDAVWCLGDTVGYGASPSQVIAELRRRKLSAVAGNHDLAATGLMGVEEFNPVAAEAVRWTAERLTGDERAWFGGLPLVLIVGVFTLVHGSLRAPEWEYLLEPDQAEAHFKLQTTPYSLIGHSHIAFYAAEMRGRSPVFYRATDGQTVELGDARLIVNPGSVGQPRDHDPRASYVLYDEAAATITWHRVEYDVVAAQRAIVDAGLPRFLAERLADGR